MSGNTPGLTNLLGLTRPELETLRDSYQLVMESTAYSNALKRQADADLARVTERLDQAGRRSDHDR